MGDDSTTMRAAQAASLFAGEAWFDPIEAGIRERIRGFIEALFEEELTAALGRGRCERAVGAPRGYRNGTRAPTAGQLWSRAGQRAARPEGRHRGRHAGVAQRGAAPLRADDPAGGGADRRGL